MVSINTIKSWFQRGMKPTAAQFAAVFDSFWHKSEKIQISDVESLDSELSDIKDTVEVLDNSHSVNFKYQDGTPIAVQKANEMGIPIVCVNRFPDGGEYSKSYSDDLEAGRMQGEFMAARLPQGAKVVYLKGASGNAAAEGRWEGFKKYCLDKRSDVKLLAFADAKWSTAEAMKDMSLWLDMFPQIDGVICGNDGMAMGAIAALKGAGRLSGVLISGVDATGDALAAIKTGEMAQTVKQDAAGQAKGVFSLVQQSMQGQKPDNVLVPYTSITRENVSQFAK